MMCVVARSNDATETVPWCHFLPMALIAEDLTRSVIGAFYEVYNELGFGFLEKVYSKALQFELRARGHSVSRELHVPVFYKGMELTTQRLDTVVDDILAIEVKSTERLPPKTGRQLLNYLCATRVEVGLVLHFGPEPKFFRMVSTNQHRKKRLGSASGDSADASPQNGARGLVQAGRIPRSTDLHGR